MNATTPDFATLLVWVVLPAVIILISWLGLFSAIAWVREISGVVVQVAALMRRGLAISTAQLTQPAILRDLGFAWVFLLKTHGLSPFPWVVVVPKTRPSELALRAVV